ncbi:hypothetical protein V2J09_009405 [Rumex salicifolius]
MENATPNTIFHNYIHSLSQTPLRLKKRMLATWTPDEELNQVRMRSGADMKRRLTWYDLIALGTGGMLGVGVFVTTGLVARRVAGPAVFLSYIVAGISALLSSMCYTEFSISIPAAGGAFSYLRVTFGEFVGYFAGANILMEYVLSNAAVARSFTEYLSSVFGVEDPNFWRVEVPGFIKGYNMLDFPAVALIFVLTLCLCYSTKESSLLNLIMTVFHVALFCFIIVVGFYKGSSKNLVSSGGIAPFGAKGVFDGAAIVYFSYIGYDSVSTLAEEIRKPSRNLPVGIVGSVLVVSSVYCLLSLSLCFMVPYNEISDKASFAIAFQRIRWRWASNLVGAGASLGIVASLLVAMLGQARYLCVMGRARLVPVWLAKVHPSTGTPLNATLFLGVCTAAIALFTDLDIVIEIISLGTLLVFYMVSNALIYRRYAIKSDNHPAFVLVFLLLLTCGSIGLSLAWKLEHGRWGLLVFGCAIVALTALFHQYAIPSTSSQQLEEWLVPLMPWPAAISVFLNIFLMSTLKMVSFQRFGIWAFLVTLFYVLYGVHSAYRAEELTSLETKIEMPQLPYHLTVSTVFSVQSQYKSESTVQNHLAPLHLHLHPHPLNISHHIHLHLLHFHKSFSQHPYGPNHLAHHSIRIRIREIRMILFHHHPTRSLVHPVLLAETSKAVRNPRIEHGVVISPIVAPSADLPVEETTRSGFVVAVPLLFFGVQVTVEAARVLEP